MKSTKLTTIQPLLTLFILLMLSSCKTIDIRGQYIDDVSISNLEKKQLTKGEVVNLIGTPTIEPDYSPDTWYYIHRSLARRAWFNPQIIEQRILKIKFNKNDKIEEVVVLNNSHRNEINVLSDYTKTHGTEASGFQRFVRNIGRFNKTTDGKNKRKQR